VQCAVGQKDEVYRTTLLPPLPYRAEGLLLHGSGLRDCAAHRPVDVIARAFGQAEEGRAVSAYQVVRRRRKDTCGRWLWAAMGSNLVLGQKCLIFKPGVFWGRVKHDLGAS
jgi:hypothetical protein